MKAIFLENKIAKILAVKAASVVNKNAALGPLSPVRYAEVPEPEIPNPRWVKVRNRACGLCGTDIHLIYMDMDPGCFPAALPGIDRKFLGHETFGVIVDAGDDADGLKPGDRVAMRIDWPSCFQLEIDPPCPQCERGNYMLCENLGLEQMPIRDTGGGFSPFMVLHRSQAFRIPDDVSDERAVLIEPAAVGVHSVLRRKPGAGENVLVVGAGTIGLMTVAVARAYAPDARITCLARYPFQADAARRLGADAVVMDGDDVYSRMAERSGARLVKGYFGNEILLGGFDVVYDTIGSDGTLKNALRWTKGGGDLVLIGVNFNPGKFDYTPIWNQEIRVIGVNSHANENGGNSFDLAAKLLARDDFPVDEIVTHRLPLKDYKKAIRMFLAKGKHQATKIVLEH